MSLKRRSFVKAAVMLPIALFWNGISSSIIDAAGFRKGGTSGIGVSVNLATMALVNTSGSTQGVGSISPFFYLPFKKGDIVRSDWPIIKISGVAQPHSYGLDSYYSDGSLRGVAVFFRTTASIAGSTTQPFEIWSGGSKPAASARALSELPGWSVPANCVTVNGTGKSGTGFGFPSGTTWSAWLTNDANNVEQFVYMDGAAGKVWRILTHMAATQGGAAHGQLEVYHYIAALTDGSGNLGGFRYLPRMCQPWYDVDSPAKNWRAFTALNWKVGAATATPFLFGQTAGSPFTAKSFTASSSSAGLVQCTFSAEPGYYCGAQDATVLGGYLTGITGLAGLDGNSLYFLVDNNTTAANLGNASYGGGDIVLTSSGSATFNPAYVCTTFGNIFGYDKDVKWNFFQGAGSITAESAFRVTIDKTYWRSIPGLIPAWSLALNGVTNGGTIQEASWHGAGPFDYSQVCIGYDRTSTSIGGEGVDHPGLGPISQSGAQDFFNQSTNSEKFARLAAYLTSNLAASFKTVSTRTIVNLSDPGKSYTGFPTNKATALAWSTQSAAACQFDGGHSLPPNNGYFYDSTFMMGMTYGSNHEPEGCYWGYLRFGQPEQHDILQELANHGVLQIDTSASGRNPTSPSTKYAM